MANELTIDRMELADTGQPKKLAELLIAQIQVQLDQLLPIPIEVVASACGIEGFRTLSTEGFEGGLIQNEEKTRGYVLLKEGTRPDRRRFTVAHELGHFVNPYHFAPKHTDQLLCTKQYLAASGTTSDPRMAIEIQANEFAANLLMPEKQLRSVSNLWGSPQIQAILDLQALCNVSKEAASRRFLDLHGDPCAVVFSQAGKVRYALSRGGFPYIDLKQGHPIPRDSLTKLFTGAPGDISEQEETEPDLWIGSGEARNWDMWEEVLIQEGGYRMTLLIAEKNLREQDDFYEERWKPRFKY